MTITTTDLSNWLGVRITAALDATQLAAALQDANNYCNGYLQAMGVTSGGAAFDSAVFSVAKVSVLRQLDAMGIKPASLNMGETLSIGSDVDANVTMLMRMADERLKMAVIAGASHKPDLYIKRLRGGQGMR